jgi:NAD(P)-dependent dehydrogenase (short-subunit alcohol dehydrogenase family)
MDVNMGTNSNKRQIVITGSTRGIGFGLADIFLERGCTVTVSGRNQAAVDKSVSSLAAKHGPDAILGQACDVCQPGQVQLLWNAAFTHFGKVDIWINNAGISAPQFPVWKLSPDLVKSILDTNILGVFHGSKVAVEGMLRQGYGSLYNMEGFGSDGRKRNGMTIYGTTKQALSYFTDCLVNETRDTPLIVGAIRPGMVITDLITSRYEGKPEEWERAKVIFNKIAERVEVVTPWIADQVLANRETGQRIVYMSPGRMTKRMLSMLFKKRSVVD